MQYRLFEIKVPMWQLELVGGGGGDLAFVLCQYTDGAEEGSKTVAKCIFIFLSHKNLRSHVLWNVELLFDFSSLSAEYKNRQLGKIG
jgi:hypothetical protein